MPLIIAKPIIVVVAFIEVCNQLGSISLSSENPDENWTFFFKQRFILQHSLLIW